jgi:coenzyme F420-reducing hydrogenase gamma subunit
MTTHTSRRGRRPTLAVWKFASCDGCQLSILDCEDELLELADVVQIAHFPEATPTVLRGPYDLSLVEGSVTTPDDARRIHKVRAASHRLVTIGACATAGGIQALRNTRDVGGLAAAVYPRPDTIAVLDRSTPIRAHVTVDAELRGCPVDKGQVLEAVAALLQERKPRLPSASVCVECKRRGLTCVAVADGTPCLGPVTLAGCGALCPGYGRGCYGCFGPYGSANTASLAAHLRADGASSGQVERLYATFNAGAPAFAAEAGRQRDEEASS